MKPQYPILDRLQDLSSVLKGLWFLLLLNLLAIVTFIFFPQGTDLLLAVAEDLGSKYFTPATAMLLILGVLFWSISSRFCTRFLISITDSSGHSLPDNRVTARKKMQEVIAMVFLFLPPVIILAAIIKVWLNNYRELSLTHQSDLIIGILQIIAYAVLSIAILYTLFVLNGVEKLARWRFFRWLKLTPLENVWMKKLYGIFNDLRVDIPESLAAGYGADLPRGEVLPNGMTVPKSKYCVPAANNPSTLPGGVKTWLFIIKWRFYKHAVIQLLVLFTFSLLIILLLSFIASTETYIWFGAMALLCIAFGCWQAVYTMTHFADKVQKYVPVRLLLFVLFLGTTIFNNDHPVRTLQQVKSENRQQLPEHFQQWIARLRSDSCNEGYFRDGDKLPVIFVCAEGGALRTGAFTAMMLAKLADSFPLFPRYIYCYSSVSGGTVGVNLFNAAVTREKSGKPVVKYDSLTQMFFKKDLLAPVIGKLAFGEILNYYIPWHIERLDRAVALERGMEHAWDDVYGGDNLMSGSFQAMIGPQMPAILVNTTEAETGLQCLWSSVRTDLLPLGKERDLYGRYPENLAYSTAINLSTRFPLVSPGAEFEYVDSLPGKLFKKRIRRHYVDGGYFENKGAETLLQVLQALPLTQLKIKPYIMQFNFGENDSTFIKGTRSFSEVSEIINGIYNTRGGRGRIAQFYLHKYVTEIGGEFIDLYLPATTARFPLNWVISNNAVDRLNQSLDSMTRLIVRDKKEQKDEATLKRLFFYQGAAKRCTLQ